MHLNPFDGPRAKIERSKAHFNDLIVAERTYGEEQPVHLEVRVDEGTGQTIIMAVVDKLPSLREAAIVADVLSNFRSALDLAVCAAARLAGAKETPDTYFHFSSTEQKWDETVKGRMKFAPQNIRDVVRALKPWKDGNRLLYAMNKIAVGDKHRLIVPTGGLTREMTLDNFQLRSPDGKTGAVGVQLQVPMWKPGEREVEFVRLLEPGSTAIVGGPVDISLRFGFADDLLSRYPMIRTLYQMGSICENAIDLIEAAANT